MLYGDRFLTSLFQFVFAPSSRSIAIVPEIKSLPDDDRRIQIAREKWKYLTASGDNSSLEWNFSRVFGIVYDVNSDFSSLNCL